MSGGRRAAVATPSRWIVRGGSRPAALILGTILTACAGGTAGSGVGDAWLDAPPFYAGNAPDGRTGPGTVYLPITFQAVQGVPPSFGPTPEDGGPLALLLEEMNGYLEVLAAERGWTLASAPRGRAPDVRFGCELDGLDECAIVEGEDGFRIWDDGYRLSVTRPDVEWRGGAGMVLEAAGAAGMVMITLEIDQLWPRQTNWRGSKVVELGPDRVVPLPWLTALDTPVQVLQLTGALVGWDGRALRIGAEGIRVRRTPIVAAGFGLQALLGDDEVEAARVARVDDDPQAPLLWEIALEELVEGLFAGDGHDW